MASSDNDNGRMLSLLEALFNGQKRTLGLVEAAIEKFSVVEIELTKINRKINVVHDAALQRHSETMSKFDERFSVVEADISKLKLEMHQMSRRQHGEIMLRFDAVAARLEETERLLDERSLDIKRTQIELVSQYNEILTALQLSTNASQDVQGLDERLSELERRMQA